VAEDAGWFFEAARILENDSDVGQVRLRLRSERVRRRHLETGKREDWTPRTVNGSRYLVAPLHYTYNPSLCRVSELSKIHPASHEGEAVRNYMKHWPLVAQHLPGAFAHAGVGNLSLRRFLGR
jgi:hypothetical protein